jgi:hypothetical protein
MTTTAKKRAPKKSKSPKATTTPVIENRRSSERTGFVDLLAEALLQAHGFDRRVAR